MIGPMGVEAHAWEADLADVSSIPLLYDRAEHLLGPVEIVVNNAAAWEADTFIPSGAELDNKLVELWTDRLKGTGIRAGTLGNGTKDLCRRRTRDVKRRSRQR